MSTNQTSPKSIVPKFVRMGKPFHAMYGIPPSTQYYLIGQGILPKPVKLSPQITGYPVSVIDEMIQRLYEEANKAPEAA